MLKHFVSYPIRATQRDQANAELTSIADQLRALGGLSDVQTETAFRDFYKVASDLLDEWVQFYRNYNNPGLPTRLTVNAYDTTIDSLRTLADQQNAVALERSTVIDNRSTSLERRCIQKIILKRVLLLVTDFQISFGLICHMMVSQLQQRFFLAS